MGATVRKVQGRSEFIVVKYFCSIKLYESGRNRGNYGNRAGGIFYVYYRESPAEFGRVGISVPRKDNENTDKIILDLVDKLYI